MGASKGYIKVLRCSAKDGEPLALLKRKAKGVIWRKFAFHITYLCAATARLFRYFWAVMTPTKRKLLDLEPGFSVAGEPLTCGGHNTLPYSSLRPAFNPQPAGFAFRFCPALFNSVALGKMSLEASVNPTTSPSRTLNHALRLRPAIPQNFTSSLSILAVSKTAYL